MAEHGVQFVQRSDLLSNLVCRYAQGGGNFFLRFGVLRKEFVKRRIEQAYGHGQPCHGLENAAQ